MGVSIKTSKVDSTFWYERQHHIFENISWQIRSQYLVKNPWKIPSPIIIIIITTCPYYPKITITRPYFSCYFRNVNQPIDLYKTNDDGQPVAYGMSLIEVELI